jgi:RNA polymerase sigma-70 factor (ECF subfamily)
MDEYHQECEALVRKYRDTVVSFCSHMLGDAALGEDVAQNVFLAVCQGMAHFRQDSTIQTWLFAIARKQCFKALRDGGRQTFLDWLRRRDIREGAHSELPPLPGQEPEVRLQRVRQGLLMLEKDMRALLLLRYNIGLTLDEMATSCECSEATVRRRLARALKQLRAVIEGMDNA